LTELYELLNENYVEDDDNMFRFDYSPEFLKWALSPPGWHTDWLCAVRASTTKKMVGFISAIPATIRTKTMATEMVEINFLCVHKKLRQTFLKSEVLRNI
jgi:glycylpeptide N-tetradecanoyltransferase